MNPFDFTEIKGRNRQRNPPSLKITSLKVYLNFLFLIEDHNSQKYCLNEIKTIETKEGHQQNFFKSKAEQDRN